MQSNLQHAPQLPVRIVANSGLLPNPGLLLRCPRSNALELAGALQGRVDALRRQIIEAAEAQETAATLRQKAEAQQGEVGGDGCCRGGQL